MTDAVELVPLDEDSYYQDPVGFFARLRESRPVALVWMPGYGRVWIITRYADVRAALTDPRLANKVCHWPGREVDRRQARPARQRPAVGARLRPRQRQ